MIKTTFGIKIYSSPFAEKFNEARQLLIEAVDKDKLPYLKPSLEKETDNKETSREQNSKSMPNWFTIGILFATGEIYTLYSDFNYNATHIAKHLYGDKWDGYRPYISESKANNPESDKNIFNFTKKINQIIKYCEDNDIEMIESFKSSKKT